MHPSYVSTYIGRPLALNERDFDTPLPQDDPEDSSMSTPSADRSPTANTSVVQHPLGSRNVVTTFRERARLGMCGPFADCMINW